MRPRLGLPLSTVCAIASAACLAAPAGATTTVSPSGVRFPAVAVNAKGRMVVAWERSVGGGFAVEARIGNGAGGLGRIRRLGPRNALSPRVAVGADGTSAVQWYEFGKHGVRRLRVAIARPGHAFGRSQLIERRVSNLYSLGVAVQPDGQVVSVHQRASSKTGYAVAAPGRSFGAVRDLAGSGFGSTTVGTDPRDGSALVVYRTAPRGPGESDRDLHPQLAVSTLAAGARQLTPPTGVSGSDAEERPDSEAYGSLVMGPAGVAVAYRASAPDAALVRVSVRRADGSWAPPRTAARIPNEDGTRFAGSVTAALPADGAVAAGWTELRYGYDPTEHLVSVQPFTAIAPTREDGPFSAPLSLSPSRAPSSHDDNGELDLAAVGTDSYAGQVVGRSVSVSRRQAGESGFSDFRVLSSRGDGDLLFAAAGERAYAAWQEDDRLRISALR